MDDPTLGALPPGALGTGTYTYQVWLAIPFPPAASGDTRTAFTIPDLGVVGANNPVRVVQVGVVQMQIDTSFVASADKTAPLGCCRGCALAISLWKRYR